MLSHSRRNDSLAGWLPRTPRLPIKSSRSWPSEGCFWQLYECIVTEGINTVQGQFKGNTNQHSRWYTPNKQMACSWLFAGSHNWASFTPFLPSSELYLLHWLDLQKDQNSPLKWSRAVKSSCALYFVLEGSTFPMWKREGGTFQITEIWTRIQQTPTYPCGMVGTYKASTCAGVCFITGCSLRPNHPQ